MSPRSCLRSLRLLVFAVFSAAASNWLPRGQRPVPGGAGQRTRGAQQVSPPRDLRLARSAAAATTPASLCTPGVLSCRGPAPCAEAAGVAAAASGGTHRRLGELEGARGANAGRWP
ncbi:hypothetical protein P7K49_015643 [Saguinus oedipus]|uniref:Uncharacterized protein n=1 Tax=Saguinus oedipus TaxID=9490 RepID=A0ABQ9V9T4_SAGOE|nr:hypothetical protein P7K49_015643 [Saguinus oedipus]